MSLHLVHDGGDEPSEWQVFPMMTLAGEEWVAVLTEYPDEGSLGPFGSRVEALAALAAMGRVESPPSSPPSNELVRRNSGPMPVVLIPIAALVVALVALVFFAVKWIAG